MKVLRAFTWGYDGCGSASRHFVRAANSLERRRGYLPPVFVDLRVSRKVRAANFQDNVFESIVGSSRYVWMRRLGNQRILSGKGKRIQIVDPGATDDLLDLIIQQDTRRRRVIMFCSCLQPLLKDDDGQPSCHRVAIATLLIEAARKRRKALELVEWPGEKPTALAMRASEAQQKALTQSARYIPLSSVESKIPPTAVLGWGSRVRFTDSKQSWIVTTGPAYVRRGVWSLEVVGEVQSGVGADTIAREAAAELLRDGYGPRR